MIVRIAELTIDPDRIDTYRTILAEEIEASVRLEPGVLFLFALAVTGRPTELRIVEGFADQAAYEAHLTTPHFLDYKARTADLVTALRLIETEPVLLKAKDRIAP